MPLLTLWADRDSDGVAIAMLRGMDINGSSAIVTGGASGIGAAAARLLAARGATVIVADLQADKGEALAAEINGVFAQVEIGRAHV